MNSHPDECKTVTKLTKEGVRLTSNTNSTERLLVIEADFPHEDGLLAVLRLSLFLP